MVTSALVGWTPLLLTVSVIQLAAQGFSNWEFRHNFMPCSYPDRTGPLVSVIKRSDFYSDAELKKAAFYAEYLIPNSIRNGVLIPFPTGPRRTRYLWFVLGLALAAVPALAIYLAVNHFTATSGTVHPGSRPRAALLTVAGPLLTAVAHAVGRTGASS